MNYWKNLSWLRRKKAQTISQVFVIIVSAFVLILIILWGSKAITTFGERTNDAKLVDFTNTLKQDVERVAYQRGTVKKVELIIPTGHTSVCFTKNIEIKTKTNIPPGMPPLVYERAKKTEQNVHLIPPTEITITLKNMTVPEGWECIPVEDGRITLRAQGTGREVCVTAWNSTKTCT